MFKVAIIDESGKNVSPNDLPSVVELREAMVQAKQLIERCERLVTLKEPKSPAAKKGGIAYM